MLPPHQEISRELIQVIDRELDGSEKVRWMGQPDPRKYARQGLPAVLFGIPWTAFALFWMAGASGFKVPDFSEGFEFFPLFGIPFVLIGFGMLSSPYWYLRQARKTVYLITDDRALIIKGGRKTSVRSFSPEKLHDLTRTQGADGSGDVVFFQERTGGKEGQTTKVGFIAIPDVKTVQGLLRELAEKESA